jgi:tryptophan synthase alpha chain
MPPPGRLAATFERLRAEQRAAFIPFFAAGDPDLETTQDLLKAAAAGGADIIEIGVPFSDPIADGPVILAANQEALNQGTTVEKSFEFAKRVAAEFPIPFLFMTYGNIPFKRGMEKFASDMKACGIQGAIVPDMPPEEGEDYLAAMKKHDRDPIFIFTPASTEERLRYLDSFAGGFIYCVARKGITGVDTDFSSSFADYLARCRKATRLPLAVGFGVQEKQDVDFLKGKADIAVIGTQSLRVYKEKGLKALGEFLRGMR